MVAQPLKGHLEVVSMAMTLKTQATLAKFSIFQV